MAKKSKQFVKRLKSALKNLQSEKPSEKKSDREAYYRMLREIPASEAAKARAMILSTLSSEAKSHLLKPTQMIPMPDSSDEKEDLNE